MPPPSVEPAVKPVTTDTVTVTVTSTFSSTETLTATATTTLTATVLSTATITTGGPIIIDDLSPDAWYKLYKIMAVSKYITDRGQDIDNGFPL